MNGPEHYAESERFLGELVPTLERLARSSSTCADMIASASLIVAQAQVHATLALAAATALDPTSRHIGSLRAKVTAREWVDLTTREATPDEAAADRLRFPPAKPLDDAR